MIENYRRFDVADPFGRTWIVEYKWLQNAISIRHADAVDVTQTVAGRTVVARASVDASVPRRLRVELQVHALCTKVTK